jgi:hypothetical protein
MWNKFIWFSTEKNDMPYNWNSVYIKGRSTFIMSIWDTEIFSYDCANYSKTGLPIHDISDKELNNFALYEVSS